MTETTISCKHLIYTSVETDTIRGYQVTASSPGIPEDDISLIEKMSAPQRVIPMDFDFKEATMCYILPSGNLSVTRMVNVGEGYDGRPNTIYTHNIIMSPEDYADIRADVRQVENHFIVNMDLRGDLEELLIKGEEPVYSEMDERLSGEMLTCALDSLLAHRRVIFVIDSEEDEKDIVLGLLALLPLSFRRGKTFSTFVMEPEDLDMDFMVVPEKVKRFNENSLPKEYCTFELSSGRVVNKPEKHTELAAFISESVANKDPGRVSEVYTFIDRYAAPDSDINNMFEYWHVRNIIDNVTDPRELADAHFRLGELAETFNFDTASKHFIEAIEYTQDVNDIDKFIIRTAHYLNFLKHNKKDDEFPVLIGNSCDYLNENAEANKLTAFVDEIIKKPISKEEVFEAYTSWLDSHIINDTLNVSGDEELHHLYLHSLDNITGYPAFSDIFSRVCVKGYERFKNSKSANAREYIMRYIDAMPNLPIKNMENQYDSLLEKLNHIGASQDYINLLVSKRDYQISRSNINGAISTTNTLVESVRDDGKVRVAMPLIRAMTARHEHDNAFVYCNEFLKRGYRLPQNDAINMLELMFDIVQEQNKLMQMKPTNIAEKYRYLLRRGRDYRIPDVENYVRIKEKIEDSVLEIVDRLTKKTSEISEGNLIWGLDFFIENTGFVPKRLKRKVVSFAKKRSSMNIEYGKNFAKRLNNVRNIDPEILNDVKRDINKEIKRIKNEEKKADKKRAKEMAKGR